MKRLPATFVYAFAFLFLTVSPAHAIKVLVATIAFGEVQVSGLGEKNSDITWEGNVETTSNKFGGFWFSTTNLPIGCVGELSDGVLTIDVVIFGCTTVQVGGGGEVAATGQTVCYDSIGNPTGCGGTGQDGEYQAGIPLPTPRFTVNGDGTVTDNLTGLIWLQDASCFGTITWADALASANGLASGACGLTDGSVAGDWRLPNVRELQSVIHYGFVSPALSNAAGTAKWTMNGDAFNNVLQALYWSSTTTYDGTFPVPVPVEGLVVDFSRGSVIRFAKTDTSFVLPVRGGL